MNRNLFATILTNPAPSANYRGESEENRLVIQKIAIGDRDYPIISAESIRNALREILAMRVPCNRRRLYNDEQLAVEYREYPDPDKYADDYFFGYLVADPKAVKQYRDRPAKRDSVLRVNLAVALTPYRYDVLFHQSPRNGGESPFRNAAKAALIHQEVAHTAFQYPFALPGKECVERAAWTRELLRAIGELTRVAGGQARSLYDMGPASIVARLTPRLVAGYDTYGFRAEGDFVPLKRIGPTDLPGSEFWVGGEIVRRMETVEYDYLAGQGVRLRENPERLLAELADEWLVGDGLS
jgi:CRISPR-associated protein Cst2